MNKSKKLFRFLSVLTLACAFFNPAQAGPPENDQIKLKSGTFDNDFFAAGEKVNVDNNLNQDLYATGNTVGVHAPVHGDVFVLGGDVNLNDTIGGGVLAAAGKIETRGAIDGDALMFGGELTVKSQISGDILLLGRKIRIERPVAGNVRVGGWNVKLLSTIGGNAVLAGKSVYIGDNAYIEGKVTLAASELRINGKIDKGLRAVAQRIVIAGEIGGDANLRANEIIILDTARISGDLVYYSPNPIELTDDIRIGGDIAYIHSEDFHEGKENMLAAAGATHFVWLIGLMLTAVVISFAVPGMFPSVGIHMQANKWKCFGVGLVTLISAPVTIFLLGASVIGIPLALILGIAFAFALMIGYFSSAFAIGRKCLSWLKRRPGPEIVWQIKSSLLGLLLLGVVIFIPMAGMLINIFALAIGLGALLLNLMAVRKHRQT